MLGMANQIGIHFGLWLDSLPNDQPFECMELSMIIAAQILVYIGISLSGSTVTDLTNEYDILSMILYH